MNKQCVKVSHCCPLELYFSGGLLVERMKQTYSYFERDLHAIVTLFCFSRGRMVRPMYTGDVTASACRPPGGVSVFYCSILSKI
jgi:hypothetical protein